MSEFAKEISYKRIRGIWETYVGNPRKKIHPNQFRGQVKSALDNGILTTEDIMRMKEEIEKDIEANTLYPRESKESKLERFHQFEEIVNEILTQRK